LKPADLIVIDFNGKRVTDPQVSTAPYANGRFITNLSGTAGFGVYCMLTPSPHPHGHADIEVEPVGSGLRAFVGKLLVLDNARE